MLALTSALSVAACGVTFTPDSARADEPADPNRIAAKSIVVRGAEALEAGNCREALDLFERAANLYPSPKIEFDIGLARKCLGDAPWALHAFETFLEARVGDVKSEGKAEALTMELRARVLAVEVKGGRDGNELAIDGKPWEHFPLKATVYAEPGAHLFAQRAPGGKDLASQSYDVVSWKHAVVDLTPPEDHTRLPIWAWVAIVGGAIAAGSVAIVMATGSTKDPTATLGTGRLPP
jgi:hypothetical protein